MKLNEKWNEITSVMSMLFLKFKCHSTSNFRESFHSIFEHETHQEGRNKPHPLSHPLPQALRSDTSCRGSQTSTRLLEQGSPEERPSAPRLPQPPAKEVPSWKLFSLGEPCCPERSEAALGEQCGASSAALALPLGAGSLFKPASLWKPAPPSFRHWEAQGKRGVAGQFPALPPSALLIMQDSHRQDFIKKRLLSHLGRNSVTIEVFPQQRFWQKILTKDLWSFL